MKLSFVIPAYNEEKMIGPCLTSVLAEMARTPGADCEVVVVNNASKDATREVAQSFAGVRVVDEMKKGLVQARHAGFVATTGELVANIDADTEVPPGWLATVLREFARDPKLVALSGPYIFTDLSWSTGLMVKIFYFFGWLGHAFNQYVLRTGAMLQGGNFIIRRDAWERAGGFDTSIAFYGEDTDVAKRIAKHGKVKWTWRLPMYTSGRRLAHEGVLRAGYTYALNFFAVSFTGKPATREYTDIRPK